MKKSNIVIVDDFENTLWVIEFTLKPLRPTIFKATNGKEALKYFDGRQIDLVITDLNMPVMNGIELVEEIRKIPKYEFIPIIMLTTETSSEKKRKADEVKVTAWIQKPFKQERFMKVIQKCLK